MRYLILILLFYSCNSDRATSMSVESFGAVDSLIAASDSTNEFLREMDTTLSNTIAQVKYLSRLSKQKEVLQARIKDPVYLDALQYIPSDEKDQQIRKLTEKILAYEREIARLKRKIAYDSLVKSDMGKNYDIVPEEKPNDKSLVITLNKKIRGDGEISETGVSVWIMKYTKKAKKTFKGYDNCQQKDLNLLDAKEANRYKGQYFFNDIEPGEYLIKVCALYGNWMVINKKDYKQEISMLMSPPIQ